jgi:Methylamine utilisation protein MauE
MSQSTFRTDRLETLATGLGAHLFGATLAVSAVAKSWSPVLAELHLERVGVHPTIAPVALVALLAWECILACYLLLRPSLVVHVAGAATALVFLGAYVIRETSAPGCGCFGDLEVPAALTVSLLTIGSISCIHQALQCREEKQRIGRGTTAALAVASAALLTVGFYDRDRRSQSDILRALVGSTTDATVVVGSWNCARCREHLDRAGREADARRCVLITRTGDRGNRSGIGEACSHISVPTSTWVRLIGKSGRAIYRVTRGEIRLVDDP